MTKSQPFRLSSSNSKIRKNSYVKEKEAEERELVSRRKFRARKIPGTHKVPFMCFYSEHKLTTPQKVSLKTEQRSNS